MLKRESRRPRKQYHNLKQCYHDLVAPGYIPIRLARLELCVINEEVERPILGRPQQLASVIRVAQGNRLI